jgi:1-acyl-sn-glycerol-3-phosphate acyltransferase
VIGSKNIPPKGAFIFAVNHQSYFDPPVVGAAVPRVLHFFAKKELFEKFLFRTLITGLNAIPVRRGVYDPEAISRAMAVLNNGRGLMIFPEGTRDNGHDFLPPKPGIGMIAKRTGAPIIPAYAHGTNRLKLALWGRRGIIVKIGQPILPEDINRYDNDKDGYQALADRVMSDIGQLKQSVVSDENMKAKAG